VTFDYIELLHVMKRRNYTLLALAIAVTIAAMSLRYFVPTSAPDTSTMTPMHWVESEVSGNRLVLVSVDKVKDYTFGRGGVCRVSVGMKEGPLVGMACSWKLDSGRIVITGQPPSRFSEQLTLLRREDDTALIRDSTGSVHTYRYLKE